MLETTSNNTIKIANDSKVTQVECLVLIGSTMHYCQGSRYCNAPSSGAMRKTSWGRMPLGILRVTSNNTIRTANCRDNMSIQSTFLSALRIHYWKVGKCVGML